MDSLGILQRRLQGCYERSIRALWFRGFSGLSVESGFGEMQNVQRNDY